MTEGEKRRSQIIKILKDSKSPVSGTKLAKVLKVSRQVIRTGYGAASCSADADSVHL